jgi:hypothetical protein
MPFASAATTTAVQATSHSVLGHYFASLMGYTGFLVILGITLIWLIKRHPHKIAWLFPSLKQRLLAQAQVTSTIPSPPYAPSPAPTWGGNPAPAPSLNPALLHIEASVSLETGQNLHVVQAQGQRLLVSSGVAGVQILTQLSQQQPALDALSYPLPSGENRVRDDLSSALSGRPSPAPTVVASPEGRGKDAFLAEVGVRQSPPKAEAVSRNPLPNPTHYPTPPLPLGKRATPTLQAPTSPTPTPITTPSRAFFETLRQTLPPDHLALSATSTQQRRPPRG